MAHKSDTTTLGGRTEEGHTCTVLAQLFGVGQHGLPGGASTGVLVVLHGGEMGTEGGIRLDDTAESDLQKRDERGAKVPSRVVLAWAHLLSTAPYT